MGCPKLTYFENSSTLKVAYRSALAVEKPCTRLFVFNRKSSAGVYRFGFNGMEKNDEVKGKGNSYTTEFRQYDARLGRWLSLDSLMIKFPWQSPYVSFDNRPTTTIDPTGESGIVVVDKKTKTITIKSKNVYFSKGRPEKEVKL